MFEKIRGKMGRLIRALKGNREDLYVALKERAKKLGLTVSEYVSMLIQKHLEEEDPEVLLQAQQQVQIQPQVSPSDFVKQLAEYAKAVNELSSSLVLSKIISEVKLISETISSIRSLSQQQSSSHLDPTTLLMLSLLQGKLQLPQQIPQGDVSGHNINVNQGTS